MSPVAQKISKMNFFFLIPGRVREMAWDWKEKVSFFFLNTLKEGPINIRML